MKKPSRQLDGILLLNKSLGHSSNHVLQQAKRLFNAAKAGHTGSLDPLASGMLPICFGQATKFAQYLITSDKRYTVSIKLGMVSDTGDAEGEIIDTNPVPDLNRDKIEAVLNKFIGPIEQTPPMHSAIKHQGQPLYKLARRGITVERKVRKVTIRNIVLNDFDDDNLHLTVDCTTGTYIRTLAEDIGQAMGCGAYVVKLHRDHVSPFEDCPMITMSELNDILQEAKLNAQDGENVEAINKVIADALDKHLLPIDHAITSFPEIKITNEQSQALIMGQFVCGDFGKFEQVFRVYNHDKQFIGLCSVMADGRLRGKRLMATAPA